jgi:hypothetical protein
MKPTTKKTVADSKTETPANSVNEIQSLVLVKKKLTVAEKLDKIQSFDAINGRYDYLTARKKELDQFGKSQNGFMGATMELEDDNGNSVKISNPVIIEELTGIAKMRLHALITVTEKEIEAFEV